MSTQHELELAERVDALLAAVEKLDRRTRERLEKQGLSVCDLVAMRNAIRAEAKAAEGD